MELRKIEVEVTPEINDIGVAFKEMILAYKAAKKDGWQPSMDIPAVLMGSFTGMTKAFEGIEKVGAEAKSEPIKASLGALIPVSEGIDILLEKENEVVVSE